MSTNGMATDTSKHARMGMTERGRAAGEIDRIFGIDVFTERTMQARLPKDVFKNIQRTIKHAEPLDPEIANIVAAAMKDQNKEFDQLRKELDVARAKDDKEKAKEITKTRTIRREILTLST